MSIYFTLTLASASCTAFINAAGEPIAPASPQPFAPSGLCVHGVTLVATLNDGKIVGSRHRVVHVASGEKLTGAFFVDTALEQRLADALRDASVHLAFDDHRIDDVAEVVAGRESRRP